jgi:hypothetical protein
MCELSQLHHHKGKAWALWHSFGRHGLGFVQTKAGWSASLNVTQWVLQPFMKLKSLNHGLAYRSSGCKFTTCKSGSSILNPIYQEVPQGSEWLRATSLATNGMVQRGLNDGKRTTGLSSKGDEHYVL